MSEQEILFRCKGCGSLYQSILGFVVCDCSGEQAEMPHDVWVAMPAQDNVEPVAWQFYQDGEWWNGDDRIKGHRANTEAAGIPVRNLYAAPREQK